MECFIKQTAALWICGVLLIKGNITYLYMSHLCSFIPQLWIISVWRTFICYISCVFRSGFASHYGSEHARPNAACPANKTCLQRAADCCKYSVCSQSNFLYRQCGDGCCHHGNWGGYRGLWGCLCMLAQWPLFRDTVDCYNTNPIISGVKEELWNCSLRPKKSRYC